MKDKQAVTDIFWTGGMDSTFVVLNSLMTTDNFIQTHYIVRSEDSTGIEIDTMISLRRLISRKYPEVMSRFLPPIYINEGLIPVFEDVTEQINELRQKCIVTEQYSHMANYCKANKINQIEVAITKETSLLEKFKHYERSLAFKCFSYPILHLTKIDIFRLAKEEDWYDILLATVFCHRPKKKITPCGTCGPCNDAVMAGMGFRLPLIPRLKANLTIPLRKYWRKNYLRHDETKLFRFIKKKFENRF